MSTPAEQLITYGRVWQYTEADEMVVEILNADLSPTTGVIIAVMIMLAFVMGFWDDLSAWFSTGLGKLYSVVLGFVWFVKQLVVVRSLQGLYTTSLFALGELNRSTTFSRLCRLASYAGAWLLSAHTPLLMVARLMALVFCGAAAYFSLLLGGGQFLSGLASGLYSKHSDMELYCWCSPRDPWLLMPRGRNQWLAEFYCLGRDAGLNLRGILEGNMELLDLPHGEMRHTSVLVVVGACALGLFQLAWAYHAFSRARIFERADKPQSAVPGVIYASQGTQIQGLPVLEPEYKLKLQALVDGHAKECEKYEEKIKAQEGRLAAEVEKHRATRQQMEEGQSLVKTLSASRISVVETSRTSVVEPRKRDPDFLHFKQEAKKKAEELREVQERLGWVEDEASATKESLSNEVERLKRELAKADDQAEAKVQEALSKDAIQRDRQLSEVKSDAEAKLKKARSEHTVELNRRLTEERARIETKEREGLTNQLQLQRAEVESQAEARLQQAISENNSEMEQRFAEAMKQVEANVNRALSDQANQLQLQHDAERAQAEANVQQAVSDATAQLQQQLVDANTKAEKNLRQAVDNNAHERGLMELHLEEVHSSAAAERLSLTLAKESAEGERDALREEVNTLRTERDSLRQEGASVITELSARNSDLAASQQRIEQLERLGRQVEKENESLVGQILELSKEINDLKIENDLLQGFGYEAGSGAIIQQRDAAREEVARLQGQLTAMQSDEEGIARAWSHANLLSAEGRITTLQAQLQTVEWKRDSSLADLEAPRDSATKKAEDSDRRARRNADWAMEDVERANKKARPDEEMAVVGKDREIDDHSGKPHEEEFQKNGNASKVRELEEPVDRLQIRLGKAPSQDFPKRRTSDMKSICTELDQARVRIAELENEKQDRRGRLSDRNQMDIDPAEQGAVDRFKILKAQLERERKEWTEDKIASSKRNNELEEDNRKLRIALSEATSKGASPFRRQGGRRS